MEEVRYKYDEAQGLTSLNPLRAKSLLKDSQIRIQEYKEESKKDLPKELQELADKIEAALGESSGSITWIQQLSGMILG